MFDPFGADEIGCRVGDNEIVFSLETSMDELVMGVGSDAVGSDAVGSDTVGSDVDSDVGLLDGIAAVGSRVGIRVGFAVIGGGSLMASLAAASYSDTHAFTEKQPSLGLQILRDTS